MVQHITSSKQKTSKNGILYIAMQEMLPMSELSNSMSVVLQKNIQLTMPLKSIWENPVGCEMGRVSLSSQLGVWGSVISSPPGSEGAPAGDAFWRTIISNVFLYMPILWDRQTMFHVTFGGKAKVWGAIASCLNVEPNLLFQLITVVHFLIIVVT